MMSPDPPLIGNEADYQAALLEYERYFDREPEPGSTDAERFLALGAAIARYEAGDR